MSKLKIIILVLFSLLVAAAVFAGLSLQQRTVTITANTPVDLFSGDQKVDTINRQANLTLRDGEYCTVAVENDYSKERQCFMIFKENRTIEITTDFSKEKLASLLKDELSEIRQVISNKYRSIINKYTICDGELLTNGSWYSGVLRDKVSTLADDGNYYHYIMRKVDDTWTLKTAPSVVISKLSSDTKDIPADVIEYSNTVRPCSPEVASPENIPSNNVEPFKFDMYPNMSY